MDSKFPDLFAALAAPFEPEEVKVRSQAGRQMQYVTARVIMNRLDDVLGPENWWDEFAPLENSVICKLSIRLPDGSVLTKSDAGGYAGMADQGDDDKSGFSDSLKRAAVKFGAGRYLYGDKIPRKPPRALQVTGAMGAPWKPAPVDQAPPTRAPEQKQPPFDFASRPTPGTGQVHAWLKALGDHFGQNLVGKTMEIARAEGLSGLMKDWDVDVVDRMVGRVVAYCRRLPNYAQEFGASESAPSSEALDQARGLCTVRAAMLHTHSFQGQPSTAKDLAEIIAALSNQAISDLTACTDLALLRKTAEAIRVATEQAKALTKTG